MVKIAVAFGVLMTMVAYSVLVERKVSAFIQDRVGPNRVAPPIIGSIPLIGPMLTRWGIWQPLADGLKAFLKEDFTPGHVRKVYFWLAPAITMIPALLTIAVIPFGSKIGSQQIVIANLNVGILYTFGIVSLGVYGIVLAGYAANSKYPFLGGIRSSAQLISYEIAMGMSVISSLCCRIRWSSRSSGPSNTGNRIGDDPSDFGFWILDFGFNFSKNLLFKIVPY